MVEGGEVSASEVAGLACGALVGVAMTGFFPAVIGALILGPSACGLAIGFGIAGK